MLSVEGEIVINQPIERVFDFVADERNEPGPRYLALAIAATRLGRRGAVVARACLVVGDRVRRRLPVVRPALGCRRVARALDARQRRADEPRSRCGGDSTLKSSSCSADSRYRHYVASFPRWPSSRGLPIPLGSVQRTRTSGSSVHPHRWWCVRSTATRGRRAVVVEAMRKSKAAQVRLRAGRRLSSAALVADGNHARIDGFVSLGVVASAIVVALGARIATRSSVWRSRW
jgi:hypothetical protein